MNAYKELAEATRNRSTGLMLSTPSGCSSVRNGCGPGMRLPFGKRMGMPRALLQVPHGGAQKTPRQFGDLIQVQHKFCPEFGWRLWSTPNDALSPRPCKQVVTLADPAQISKMKGSAVIGLCSVHGVRLDGCDADTDEKDCSCTLSSTRR